VDPYVKSALLWGLVSVLTVLVAAAGAHLLFDPPFGPAVVAAVALAAGAVVAVVAYGTERRVVENGQP
jgi:uncharacterized membrane protein